MILSDEQMQAVNHGNNRPAYWEWVTMPEGPQPIPGWAKGLHVDWMDGFMNSPSITLKTNTDLRDWGAKRFEKAGSRFMARHSDGRAEVYYHAGAIRMEELQRWNHHAKVMEKYQAFATTQQSGFGGHHYPLEIGPVTDRSELRGQTVVLRGPWHGGCPAGYAEAAYRDVSRPPSRARPGSQFWRPWHQQVAIGGLYLTNDLFLRLLARFQPHLRVAAVTRGGIFDRLEPVRGDWDAPKAWIYEREHQARRRAAGLAA